MIDELIKYDTAVLAKEKGFNWECSNVYNKDKRLEELPYYGGDGSGVLINSNVNDTSTGEDFLCTVSTQSLLQRWLREVYNIHIEVKVQDYVEHPTYYWGIFGKHKNLSLITKLKDSNEIKYNTYEEALEEGLKQALNLIK